MLFIKVLIKTENSWLKVHECDLMITNDKTYNEILPFSANYQSEIDELLEKKISKQTVEEKDSDKENIFSIFFNEELYDE